MNRLTLAIVPVVMFLASHGQEVSKRKADSLIQSLRKSISDSDRMNTFTTLAEYHIRKPGELKADLDSGATFIKSARQLNGKVRSIDADGFQMLLESMLTRERKQYGIAKDINEKAIEVLKTTSNKEHLVGMSLMEGLSEDLDGKFSIESNNGTTITILFVYDMTVKRPGILTASFSA